MKNVYNLVAVFRLQTGHCRLNHHIKLVQCWRQSIQSRGPKFFMILVLKKHAVHNAITSINISFMQSEIILISVSSSELDLFGAFLSKKRGED